MTFHPTAAAAQSAGFRACRRCRPDTSPGSTEWNIREDTAARAMRLISDGEMDRHGVVGLSSRLGYTPRHVERLLRAELGAGPLALARAQRAATARVLIETTSMAFTEIAFAAGFSSVRAFNETIRTVFATSPTDLRASRRNRARTAPGAAEDGAAEDGSAAHRSAGHRLTLRLAYRPPLHVPSLFGHLIATRVPGVDHWTAGTLHRAMRLPHGSGVVTLRPDDGLGGMVEADLRLEDLRDLTSAVQRCRRMLDLDADPAAVDAVLRTDPALAPLVEQFPGCRLPGTTDPEELAFRVVLGQQISTRAASVMGQRLTQAFGEPLSEGMQLPDGPTHHFPTAEVLADVADDDPRWPGMPASRRRTLRELAAAIVSGAVRLDVGEPWWRAREALADVRGIGPWSIEMICLRGLGDPDAFPATDLGTRLAAEALGMPSDSRQLLSRSQAWRPWRSYAAQLLWASSDHAVAHLPKEPRP